MYNLEQLQKQQVGLRLPRYLLDDIDEFTNNYSLNRSEIIIEAIKSYIEDQKMKDFYNQFEGSCQQLSKVLANKKEVKLKSIDELVNEMKP